MIAVGTRRRQVLALFLWEALILGAVGSSLGAAAGTLVVALMGANGVVFTTPGASLPQIILPYIHARFLVQMVLLGSAGACVAALYPAWKGSRMRPVEALGAV